MIYYLFKLTWKINNETLTEQGIVAANSLNDALCRIANNQEEEYLNLEIIPLSNSALSNCFTFSKKVYEDLINEN